MTIHRSPTPGSASGLRRLEPASRLQFLPGVGPKRALRFERLGLTTLEHLIRHYPRTWLDARRFVRIADLEPGELVTVDGTIHSAAAVRTRAGRTDFVAALEDGSGAPLGLYFFGQPFLARTLRKGTRVLVSGELDAVEHRMLNPMFEVVEGEVADLLHVGRLIPVHALTRGLTARGMRKAVRLALDAAAGDVPDPIPAEVVAAHGLGPLCEALAQIHFPDDEERLQAARRRLAFEELFLLQSVLELRRCALAQEGRGLATAGPGALAARARAALPFALTGDQERALAEIVADMRRPAPMQRLLLGDVGSGKTVVALLAALHALEAGHQVAFMAPTEILARQHGATLAALAAPAGAEVLVLTGATPAAERRALARRLEAGEPLLVAGTHALLEEKVRMPELGLAIVDEQHRFGVRQRATLAKKGVIPDVLVLTATPIPRTLQLAYYGDLALSTLRARPAGRGRLVTRVTGEEKFPQVLEFMARELAAGRQAFVVVPLIEQDGRLDSRAAEAEHERLSGHPLLARFRVGLLHGRLKAEEKQAVMEGFAAGEVHALVTTTVIEVGVDIPHATLMVVENAERFGLTQLHQLRGRVGRGAHRSVCVLVPGAGAGALARERVALMARTDDGFELAEADLRMRGPGELWGVRQSGLPRLKLADLARDQALLEEARDAARGVVEADAMLLQPAHAALRATLLAHYREPIELALAG
ncbi:MAG: ATP-dependent DNA helicase RecG [Candidatus Eisenbacteria bacterium]|nr:ATP-dependent DNA helicase RecG [Candidatus Eisenbacteria bacterium]